MDWDNQLEDLCMLVMMKDQVELHIQELEKWWEDMIIVKI